MSVIFSFQGLIVARSLTEQGRVKALLCLAGSPRGCWRPPPLLLACELDAKGVEQELPGRELPNKDFAPCGSLIRARATPLDYPIDGNGIVHTQIRAGALREITNPGRQLALLELLHDELEDLAIIQKDRFRHFPEYRDRLKLRRALRAFRRRLCRAGVLVEGERSKHLHGWLNMWEIDEYSPKMTGIHGLYLFACSRSCGGKPRLLVSGDRGNDLQHSFAISVSEEPEILEGVVELPEEKVQMVLAWVKLNKAALLRYWKNGDSRYKDLIPLASGIGNDEEENNFSAATPNLE